MEKEKKHYCREVPGQEITKTYWQEGESKHSWNKAGTYKDSYYICTECGNEQHFINV